MGHRTGRPRTHGPGCAGRQLRQLRRPARCGPAPGAVDSGPGRAGPVARPGVPDADIGGGLAGGSPGRRGVPIGAGRRGRCHRQSRGRPPSRSGRGAACQHPERDRRSGAFRARRPSLCRRFGPDGADRGGPQAVGGSGYGQPPGRSDGSARCPAVRRGLVVDGRGHRGGQAPHAGRARLGGGVGHQIAAGGGPAAPAGAFVAGVAPSEHPSRPGDPGR